MESAFEWIARYGYVGIFALLVLGIIGLPVPDETLLTFAGYLASKGDLAYASALGAAWLGSVCGITVSYGIGRLCGAKAVTMLHAVLHLKLEHIANAESWIRRWGKYTLLLAYFVPGVRHIAAVIAGGAQLPATTFAGYAYVGAFLWSATFLTLGYGLGEEWRRMSPLLHASLLWIVAAGLTVLIAGLFAIARRTRTPRDGPPPSPCIPP
jgi:membrane protein DedA with SNARE-associated domain